MSHGLHHVTAIAGPAARNRRFHEEVLGQRLVKRTVNFDDPATYHLYFGDEAGVPGSILTFFPWADVAPGRIGTGETAETAFRVPAGALPYWSRRLAEHGGRPDAPGERFGDPVLTFTDPDGMRLALVGIDGLESEPFWRGGAVAAEHAIRGLHGVTLLVADAAPTGAVLTNVMGFALEATDGPVARFVASGAAGGIVDLRSAPALSRGRQGGGSVHHVAYRASDDAAQAAMVRKLGEDHRLSTTEQKDRNYFRSVYFREPGGVLFEIATDVPGFAVDEPEASLGSMLKLPSFLEKRRPEIEAVLPALG